MLYSRHWKTATRAVASGDMTWEMGPDKDFSNLLEYEQRLEDFFQENEELSGVCQYHANTLPPEAVRQGLIAHSSIFVNETLYLINPITFHLHLFGTRPRVRAWMQWSCVSPAPMGWIRGSQSRVPCQAVSIRRTCTADHSPIPRIFRLSLDATKILGAFTCTAPPNQLPSWRYIRRITRAQHFEVPCLVVHAAFGRLDLCPNGRFQFVNGTGCPCVCHPAHAPRRLQRLVISKLTPISGSPFSNISLSHLSINKKFLFGASDDQKTIITYSIASNGAPRY